MISMTGFAARRGDYRFPCFSGAASLRAESDGHDLHHVGKELQIEQRGVLPFNRLHAFEFEVPAANALSREQGHAI